MKLKQLTMRTVEWYRNCSIGIMRKIIWVLFIVVFTACSSKMSSTNNTVNKVSKTQHVSKALQNEFSWLSVNYQLWQADVVALYKFTDFKVYWVDEIGVSSKGKALYEVLKNIENLGLRKDFYEIDGLSIAQQELVSTVNYLKLLTELKYGILDSLHFGKTIWAKGIQREEILDLASKAILNDDALNLVREIQPKNNIYKALIAEMTSLNLMENEIKEGLCVTHYKEDSLKVDSLSKKALVYLGFLKQDQKEEKEPYLLALQKFQVSRSLTPDGVVGNHTASFLCKSLNDYKQIVRLNIERVKFLGSLDNIILANIPGFDVKLFALDTVKWEERSVVGAKQNKTPIFEDTLAYIELNPVWNVPNKITNRELIPKQLKDSNYLANHHYEVLDGARQIVALDQIDWDNIDKNGFPYKIRQKSGNFNALGSMKFIFPNRHNVYIHDTNLKKYFKKDIRAYSHGCIRLQNPIGLAEQLIEMDGNMPLDSIHTILESKERKRLHLDKTFKVRTVYLTAGVTQGMFRYYFDVYKYDEQDLALLDQLFLDAPLEL